VKIFFHRKKQFCIFKDFVFGDFSEQEAEKLFDQDKQGVKVNQIFIHYHPINLLLLLLVSMEYR
jgi:hypothetical protein